MYLIVDELNTELEQTITLTKKVMILKAIRPYLYLNNINTGDLTISIELDSVEIASVTQSIASIKANLENDNTYYHGFVNFELDNYLRIDRDDYVVKMVGDNGYTYASNSFAGWVKEYDNRTNNTAVTVADLDSPHSLQLWSLK